MNASTRSVIAILTTVVVGAAAAAHAQDMPPMPKPGPEHELLEVRGGHLGRHRSRCRRPVGR
jgi:hypothetical protein